MIFYLNWTSSLTAISIVYHCGKVPKMEHLKTLAEGRYELLRKRHGSSSKIWEASHEKEGLMLDMLDGHVPETRKM